MVSENIDPCLPCPPAPGGQGFLREKRADRGFCGQGFEKYNIFTALSGSMICGSVVLELRKPPLYSDPGVKGGGFLKKGGFLNNDTTDTYVEFYGESFFDSFRVIGER